MGWGGRLFEAGGLLTFSAFRMGAYSKWELIQGWALIRINSVFHFFISFFCTMHYCFSFFFSFFVCNVINC